MYIPLSLQKKKGLDSLLYRGHIFRHVSTGIMLSGFVGFFWGVVMFRLFLLFGWVFFTTKRFMDDRLKYIYIC